MKIDIPPVEVYSNRIDDGQGWQDAIEGFYRSGGDLSEFLGALAKIQGLENKLKQADLLTERLEDQLGELEWNVGEFHRLESEIEDLKSKLKRRKK